MTTDSIIFDNDSEGSTNQSMLLPEPATNKGCYLSCVRREHGTGTHVFHESRVVTRNLLTSIPYTLFPRKTRSLFPHDGRYTQYYDSWMDPVARAIYEDPVVTDYL
jgi:hypothetical protein